MNNEKSFPWIPVLLGVGCLCILCVAISVAGGIAFYLLNNTDSSHTQPAAEESNPFAMPTTPALAAPTSPAAPTELPPASPSPTMLPAPTPSLMLTGNQYLDDYSFFDDFSSDSLGWPLYDDGVTIMKFENEQYSLQITEPEYIDWAYFPDYDFIPYEIWFDAQALPGAQNGTFGVFCQYQDVDNHYYVEFDLETNSYIIAQYYNGEDIPLTQQNTVGQFWYETSAFAPSPTDVNQIGISCYLDSITLFINNEFVDSVNISQPFSQTGDAAFFIYAFSFADENGYKIFIDNVSVYQPVQ